MSHESFRDRLNAYYDWPCVYTFKFIVAAAQVPEVEALLAGAQLRNRASRGGRWIAVTADLQMSDAEAVLQVYEAASEIEGLVTL